MLNRQQWIMISYVWHSKFSYISMRVLGRSDVTGDKSGTFAWILPRNISLYPFVNIIPFIASSSFLFLFQFDTFNTAYTKKNESNMEDQNSMGQEFIYLGIIDLQCVLFLNLRLLIFLYRTYWCVIKFTNNNKIISFKHKNCLIIYYCNILVTRFGR